MFEFQQTNKVTNAIGKKKVKISMQLNIFVFDEKRKCIHLSMKNKN